MSTRERMLQRGYDPAYVDGFTAGESSGHAAGGNMYTPFTKDTHRFEDDSQYKQGWTDGFQYGKGRSESTDRAMGYR